MKSTIDEIKNYIDRNFCPTKEEWINILEKSEKVREYIFSILKNKYNVSKEDLVILGSVPRMTYLKNDFDVDVFIRFEDDVDPKSVVDFLIDNVNTRYKTRVRYAEHPYLELFAEGLTFNIVPSFKTEYPNWLSPMDRSYFHHIYLVERGIQELYKEVIRLKVFLKATGVYGAEVYVGGFSGYLTELLILEYGGFEEALSNFSNWQPPVIIDLEKHYSSRQAVLDAFGYRTPLIVVDPIDRGRNVAAALKHKSFSKTISASKYLMEQPSINFFEESPHLSGVQYFSKLGRLVKYDLPILVIYLEHGKKIEDIHYSQLERLSRKIKNMAEEEGFNILKTGVFSDYERCSALFFLFSELERPKYEKVKGPYPYMQSERRFLEKNLQRIKWIGEDGRWYVLKEGRFLRAREVLKHIIDNKLVKIPKDLFDSYEIFTIEERYEEVLSDTQLQIWYINFVVGDEFWTLQQL